jgi:hypothetical protein
VNSLARPGRKLTGVFLDLPEFTGKCLQLLREAAPGMRRVAALWHPASGEVQKRAAQAAAGAMGIELLITEVAQRADFESAFTTARAQSDGVFMLSVRGIIGARLRWHACVAETARAELGSRRRCKRPPDDRGDTCRSRLRAPSVGLRSSEKRSSTTG